MRRAGFTLLELVAVLALVATFFAVGVWTFSARRLDPAPPGLEASARFHQWLTDASARARGTAQPARVVIWPAPGNLRGQLFVENHVMEGTWLELGDTLGWQPGTGWTQGIVTGWEDFGPAWQVDLDARGQPATELSWLWGERVRGIWQPGAWPTSEARP